MRSRTLAVCGMLLLAIAIAGWYVAGKPTRAPVQSAGGDEQGAQPRWFDFTPAADDFAVTPIDLRFLNERFAGEHGFIQSVGDRFVRSGDGQSVRFWAVNGPPREQTGAALENTARLLAKRGVNLLRVHGPLFDEHGEPDSVKIRRAIDIVQAMKAEGIYTHFSIYFPLWLRPAPDTAWLRGYDGTQYPYAALFFNRDFQAQYRKWWTALLTTPDPLSGKTLLDEPAVFGAEIVNEDSLFFWTFDKDRIPEPQMQLLETQFGAWLTQRYGSLEAAVARWDGLREPRDDLGAGRLGLRPLYDIVHEKTMRDQDTVRFLYETQSSFYAETIAFLRGLGFKGQITASNWITASAQVLGPLEKHSYLGGDFIDRHGYFSSVAKGDSAAWSMRNGQTYLDRSALRFDSHAPGKPPEFASPVMDPIWADKPSMISETTFSRPNRYRTEAVLLLAAYGAMQGGDALVHFDFDGSAWSVKPRFWMQPWTLMSPVMMGQFPAAALIYREGLVRVADPVAELTLNMDDLFALKGTPLPQNAVLDELRAADVARGEEIKEGQRLEPLLHFVGSTRIRFSDQAAHVKLGDTSGLIDRKAGRITSVTRELMLDYHKGVMFLDAPRAQGLVGALRSAGRSETTDLQIESGMEIGSVVAVALDSLPLATSRKILLQVMSEERSSGFATKRLGDGRSRILDIGHDPWQLREIAGVIRFKRADAASLTVTALDANGGVLGAAGSASAIRLQPQVLYYLVAAQSGSPGGNRAFETTVPR